MYVGRGNGCVRAQCPYYNRESKLQITCEGIEHGTKLATKFPSEHAKRDYQETYCFERDSVCPIKIILDMKYE